MKTTLPVSLAVLVLVLAALAGAAAAFEHQCRCRSCGSWQAGYYDPAWGMPVALVAPPNARTQTNWGWGVGNTRVTRNQYQFQRNYPGPLSYDPRGFQPIPAWPSDTNQFGVYYIRGPW